MPAWIWFVIAAAAAVAGAVLLLRERTSHGAPNRERPRWAALRGWKYLAVDPDLLGQWRGGSVAYFGGGTAHDVVAGSTFTADGRRPVYVLDQVHDNTTDCVLVAVRCRRSAPTLLELWLPSVPFQRQQMPELLGPVGERYAFVTDIEAGRAMLTRELVDVVEELGSDVTVVWLEKEWVVAAAPPGVGPARLERLLRDLGELADLLDPFDEEAPSIGVPPPPRPAPGSETGADSGGPMQRPEQA
jgi:hypothetical protein